MNNMVPKKQFEQLQTSLREEQCKAQQLQENLHWQAEQTCRQMARTQVSRELGNSVKGTGEGALPGWKAVVVEVTRGWVVDAIYQEPMWKMHLIFKFKCNFHSS